MALSEGVARALRLFLEDRFVSREVLLRFQIVAHLIREIVNHHHDAIDRAWQGAENPIENRPALHGQERFRGAFGVRPKASSQACREYDGVHTASLSCHESGIWRAYLLRRVFLKLRSFPRR